MRKLQADHRKDNGSTPEDLCVMATGGGAFKYYDRITEALGVKVIREDEMECLIIGISAYVELRDINLLTMRRHRSRFLHQRNPQRGLHLQ